MYTQATVAIFVGASIFSVLPTVHGGNGNPSTRPSRIREALPPVVAQLVTWPAESTLLAKSVSPRNTSGYTRAVRSSLDWIEKVIAPEWLPDDIGELASGIVLISDAYDGLDTTHVEWHKNGYRFRVSQTKGVLVVEISSLSGPLAKSDPRAIKRVSRELAKKIVRDVRNIRVVPGARRSQEIAPEGTRSVMMAKSFGNAVIRTMPNGLSAAPERLDPHDPNDRARFGYWWRRIGWFADSRMFCMYTLKTDGGAWRANYSDAAKNEAFRHWFSSTSTVQSEDKMKHSPSVTAVKPEEIAVPATQPAATPPAATPPAATTRPAGK